MKQDELLVNALVSSARADIGRGVRREDILESLSSLVDADLYRRVRDRFVKNPPKTSFVNPARLSPSVLSISPPEVPAYMMVRVLSD